MPSMENADFKLEIEEVVGNESSLDLDSSKSVTRRFQVRQAEREGRPWEPIPYELANLTFYGYVMQYEPFYMDLPFKQIRFVEDKEKIGEVFDAEVVYSFDYQTSEDNGQEFTLPTFSITGGKKKQLLPAQSTKRRLKRYVKIDLAEVEALLNKAIEELESNEVVPEKTKEKLRAEIAKSLAEKEVVKYQMIGWDGKKFNGVEIEAPEPKYMVPAWYPVNTPPEHPDHPGINFQFIRGLMKFVGTINSKPFYGLKPGEVKYLGPEQSWVTRTVETNNPAQPVMMLRFLELQHQFYVQLSHKDLEIGDLKIPKVVGWDHVDVHYEESMVDIGSGRYMPLAVPKQVDVVPIYEEMDFWDLFDGKKIKEIGEEDDEDEDEEDDEES